MADLADVGNALAALIGSVIYPAGGGSPSALPGEFPAKVYVGWPDPKTLDRDLGAEPDAPGSALHVSVFNLPMERNTTRYPMDEEETYPPPSTYTATIVGNVVSIGGVAPNPFRPQNIVIAVDRRPYALSINEGEATASIAARLAALIAVDAPGTAAAGSNVTVPQPHRIPFARVGGVGSTRSEVSRQEKGFQVTIWAPTNDLREAASRLITPVMAATARLDLGNGELANLTCRSNTDSNRAERQRAYRRDLVYTVEYATTLDAAAPVIIAMAGNVLDPSGQLVAETVE